MRHGAVPVDAAATAHLPRQGLTQDSLLILIVFAAVYIRAAGPAAAEWAVEFFAWAANIQLQACVALTASGSPWHAAFSTRRRTRHDAARRLCDGRSVGAGAPFLGFQWSEAFFSWSQVGSRGAGLFRSPRVRLLSAPLAHGILGAHLGSTEVTPNAGRSTPGLTLAPPPSPPRRLPGGPGAARDRSSDLVMPRLPVSTRSTGQGICLVRAGERPVAHLCKPLKLTISTRRSPDSPLDMWDWGSHKNLNYRSLGYPGVESRGGSERGEDSRYQGLG